MTTIGILGGGQLGRMLALAGIPLGLQFRFLDPAPNCPASVCGVQVVGDYFDEEALARFVDGCDVVTYEFENVPNRTALYLSERVKVYPPPIALEYMQDRLLEKEFLQSHSVPVAGFMAVDSYSDLMEAIKALGLPSVLKTRRLGYDGKGQRVLRTAADAEAAWQELGDSPLILEAFIDFQRELSLLSVRSINGETCFYPLVQNRHHEGILRESVAPAPNLDHALQILAEKSAAQLLNALDYVGVMAIEMFEIDGCLVANEMAPRVHNSGHWTIEGAVCSQFENHVRAVAGLPLGSTACTGTAVMENIIGKLPDMEAVLREPGAHLHLYGKEPRAGRKLGHITRVK